MAQLAKEEFMALISHELRTPLTCIIGMSATMLRWSLGPLSDRQRDCLQTINDSGNHLMQIIDSILDLSQSSLGKTALNIQSISLKHLVQYCVQLFQEVAETRSISLRSSSSLNLPEEDIFFGDPQRLRQILINLLDNAIKFTETHGTVRVRMSREGPVLKWQIEDTGIGIRPEDRDRLFQKFQQLEDSHRRRFGGTGLGLALTKQWVELHGGRIELESNPGHGSCFTVWLTEQQPPTPTVRLPKVQGEVVLLEEDEQSATMICELLTAAGYKVFWLVDSSTALEQIELLHPAALIVNLQFQGSSGENLVQQVHQMNIVHPPKIIGLLPRSLTEQPSFDPFQTSKTQVDAYVFTPFHPAELVNHLNLKPTNLEPTNLKPTNLKPTNLGHRPAVDP
ncbi:MAG: hybrid sensor histidine kinase/response regulator [Synechococcales cyanobacterium CRU_2_2]|nr:hybrid sensor histidine kinase/response regulator [Synechococcales cyanobacterium CRU_2_2]